MENKMRNFSLLLVERIHDLPLEVVEEVKTVVLNRWQMKRLASHKKVRYLWQSIVFSLAVFETIIFFTTPEN